MHARLGQATTLFAAFLSMFAVAAQDSPVRFQPKSGPIRLACDDLPGLCAALQNGPLGRLCAEPDTRAAIEQGLRGWLAPAQQWLALLDRLTELQPGAASLDELLVAEFYRTDWRAWRSIDLCAIAGEGHEAQPRTVLMLEATAAAAPGLMDRYTALAKRLRQEPALLGHLTLAKAQQVLGQPGLVFTHGDHGDPDAAGDGPPAPADVGPGEVPANIAYWLAAAPGQFVGGDGDPADSGAFAPTTPSTPGLHLAFDLRWYCQMMLGFLGNDPREQIQNVENALGTGHVQDLRWRLHAQDGLLAEDLRLCSDGPPSGLLAALVLGMAPPPEQPLPERTLLQWRCSFDLPKLAEAIDGLLQLAALPTLTELDLVGDLRSALTGGVALGVARPAPGSLVPRLYVSFGIGDQAAAERLLARLQELPGLETKSLELDGRPCTQMRLDGLPAALQPTWAFERNVLHVAESGLSLRALWKAKGRPFGNLKAPRPIGKGALPGFELQWHAGEIHAALAEIWLPFYEKTILADHAAAKGTVPTADLPEAKLVLEHLGLGRGVLRRDGHDLVLAMLGPTGGPEMQALISAWGPMISGQMVEQWRWQRTNAQHELGKAQMAKVHAALVAFEKRTGKRPATLGELVQGGDLADASFLLLPGETQAEPVLHEGKEVAKSSFRYFANGVEVTPESEKVQVVLIALRAADWRRLAMDREGTVHEGWGDFAQGTVDELLQRK
jgi:hypothetical protein